MAPHMMSEEEFKNTIRPTLHSVSSGTGMRRGEILNLTWNKVDFDKHMIRLESTDTKDRQARNVPICTELFEMLRNMPNKLHTEDDDNHVFQFQGKPMKDVRAALRRACKLAGIVYGRKEKGGFVFHDLRHTFNTNMRKAGVQESVIMDITGHSTREMFDRYNSIDEGDAHTAIGKLEGYFSNGDHIGDQVGVLKKEVV